MGVYCAYIHLPASYMKSLSSKIKQKISIDSLHEPFFWLRFKENLTGSQPPKRRPMRTWFKGISDHTLWFQKRCLIVRASVSPSAKGLRAESRVLLGGSPRSSLALSAFLLAKKTLRRRWLKAGALERGSGSRILPVGHWTWL